MYFQPSRLPPSHNPNIFHPGNTPPGRNNVRYTINKPAVHPPNSAVSVKYILSLADAVIARSAPPGSEEDLGSTIEHLPDQRFLNDTHGFIAILQIAWNTSAICPVLTLTATGTCNPSRLQ